MPPELLNPSIDHLREPMELRTFLGKKPDTLGVEIPPQLQLDAANYVFGDVVWFHQFKCA